MGVLKMAIIDGAAHFQASLATVYHLHPTHQLLATRAGVTVPPLDQVATAPPVAARINHNRLLVDCPDCNGAEFVWREQPLLMCCNCWNARVGGLWRAVTLPPDLAHIEAALVERLDPQSRNWTPGETVADLLRENETHAEGML